MSRRARIVAIAVGVNALLVPSLPATEIGQQVAAQIRTDQYRHYLDDVLYTRIGDDRGRDGAQHDPARDNIAATFASFGLEVELEYSGYYAGWNVVATKLGTVYPDGQYIVGAHYDSVNNPGADDDASGVAALLEMARVLSRYDTEYTVKFVAFDLEELGLIGSESYVYAHGNEDIRGMVQLDMIAYDGGGYRTAVAGHTESDPLKQAVGAAVEEYGGELDVIVDGPSDNSDHYPFEQAGFQACRLSETGNSPNPCYHKACDNVDRPNYISYAMAADHARAVVGLLADLAAAHPPLDCDLNGVPDADEIAADPTLDCNGNDLLDACEWDGLADCNGNGVTDLCDVHWYQTSLDCNENSVPDECEPGGASDCNGNDLIDLCEIYEGLTDDENRNGEPDECEQGRTWYVDDDAPSDPAPGDASISDPLEDGSPEHPFDGLAEALALALPGHEVVVADGVYTGPRNRDLSPPFRPVVIHSANGPTGCMIDCEGAGRAFYFDSGGTRETRLAGFTIINGNMTGGAVSGGAISCVGSSPTIEDCWLVDNVAGRIGGALYATSSANPLVRNCVFLNNTSGLYGGGFALRDSSATLENCVFGQNQAERGGGFYCEASTCTVRGCTFVGNDASTAGGATFRSGDGILLLDSSIFWNNTSPAGRTLAMGGGTAVVGHCDVQGGVASVAVGSGSLTFAANNIEDDPLFADAGGSDYHLLPDSPCINAGSPTAFGLGEFDLDGESRVMAGRVDIGADETTGRAYVFADLDCDGDRDGDDIGLFVQVLVNRAAYLAQYPDCDLANADINLDGVVNNADIPALVALLMDE